jgi:hypothetical protein
MAMKKACVCLFCCGVLSVIGTLAAQSNSAPVTEGRSVCVPYDPATLTIGEIGRSGDWQLRRADGAIFKVFATREDAEAGLAVAKEHTRLCYIGKSNTRADRAKYIMEYWK